MYVRILIFDFVLLHIVCGCLTDILIFPLFQCRLQTGFQSKFAMHMALVPALLLLALLAFVLVRGCAPASAEKEATSRLGFTRESVRTGFNSLLSMLLYTLYVGVATRVFQHFRCREIMGVWYLAADYTLVCYDGPWMGTAAIGYLAMFVFVLGIPLGQFAVLWKYRKFIDERKCTDKASYQQHLRIKRTYGSIFSVRAESMVHVVVLVVVLVRGY